MAVKITRAPSVMNKEEIGKHLNTLSGTKGKISYLKEVLDKHPNMVSDETRKNLRRVLSEAYAEGHERVNSGVILMENGGEDYKRGVEILKKLSDNKDAAEALVAHNEFKAAADIYASIGYKSYRIGTDSKYFGKERDCLLKAADLYLKVGGEDYLDLAASAIIEASEGSIYGDANASIKSGELLERAAMNTKQRWSQLKFLRESRERFEKAGKGVKAARIGGRIASLEEKIQQEQSRHAILAIGCLGGSAFFLSTKITANVIGASVGTSSIIGALLLIIGFVSGYFWARSKIKSKPSKIVVRKPTKNKK